MVFKYIILLFLLSGCGVSGHGKFQIDNYKQSGVPVTENYNLKVRGSGAYLENDNKTHKYGLKLRRFTVYTQWTFPF